MKRSILVLAVVLLVAAGLASTVGAAEPEGPDQFFRRGSFGDPATFAVYRDIHCLHVPMRTFHFTTSLPRVAWPLKTGTVRIGGLQ